MRLSSESESLKTVEIPVSSKLLAVNFSAYDSSDLFFKEHIIGSGLYFIII